MNYVADTKNMLKGEDDSNLTQSYDDDSDPHSHQIQNRSTYSNIDNLQD